MKNACEKLLEKGQRLNLKAVVRKWIRVTPGTPSDAAPLRARSTLCHYIWSLLFWTL